MGNDACDFRVSVPSGMRGRATFGQLSAKSCFHRPLQGNPSIRESTARPRGNSSMSRVRLGGLLRAFSIGGRFRVKLRPARSLERGSLGVLVGSGRSQHGFGGESALPSWNLVAKWILGGTRRSVRARLWTRLESGRHSAALNAPIHLKGRAMSADLPQQNRW